MMCEGSQIAYNLSPVLVRHGEDRIFFRHLWLLEVAGNDAFHCTSKLRDPEQHAEEWCEAITAIQPLCCVWS